MNKFDNILNIDLWSVEDLEKAIDYYKNELLKPHDDIEHSWFLRSIDKCEMKLDELNGNECEWLNLFK